MLIKRLDQLQRAGIIETELKADGRGYYYRLTEAGADLDEVIGALAAWGRKWLATTPEQCDPAYALWSWCQVQLDRTTLPCDRITVAFLFPDERPRNRRYWMLVDDCRAEMCQSDPGGEPDLKVEARSQAFVDWHRGLRTWRQVLRTGEITISGQQQLRRALP